MNTISTITTSFLCAGLLITAPAFGHDVTDEVAQKDIEKEAIEEEVILPSALDSPTAAGSPITDPGKDRDRINPNSPAPTGLEKVFTQLDRNRDEVLDVEELEGLESPAAGMGETLEGLEAQGEENEESLQFYDINEDGVLDEEEFRQWPVPQEDLQTGPDEEFAD